MTVRIVCGRARATMMHCECTAVRYDSIDSRERQSPVEFCRLSFIPSLAGLALRPRQRRDRHACLVPRREDDRLGRANQDGHTRRNREGAAVGSKCRRFVITARSYVSFSDSPPSRCDPRACRPRSCRRKLVADPCFRLLRRNFVRACRRTVVSGGRWLRNGSTA